MNTDIEVKTAYAIMSEYDKKKSDPDIVFLYDIRNMYEIYITKETAEKMLKEYEEDIFNDILEEAQKKFIATEETLEIDILRQQDEFISDLKSRIKLYVNPVNLTME